MSAGPDPFLGRTIAGKFAIEAFVGSGAMGAVYRARQTSLDKIVAIKVMHADHAKDPQFAVRFQREAKAASRLSHPNSLHVLDYGEEPDGTLYIAMEYLEGPTLLKLMKAEWPLHPLRIVDLMMQTLAPLAVAHDLGIVHRDLKPDNIIVMRGVSDDGRPVDVVKVCDFGIAKIVDSRAYKQPHDKTGSDGPLTTQGFLVGTPEYMSPEQGRGEKLDARSDLYSMGVILYQLLTGRVPFDAENAIGVILKHVTDPPVPPSRIVPQVMPSLEAICMRALHKAREARFQSAREMRAYLRAALEGRVPEPHEWIPHTGPVAPVSLASAPDFRPVRTPPKLTLAGTAVEKEGRSAGRTALLAFLGVLLMAVVATAGIVAFSRFRNDRRVAAAQTHEQGPVPELTLPVLDPLAASSGVSLSPLTTVDASAPIEASVVDAAPRRLEAGLKAPPSASAAFVEPVPTPTPPPEPTPDPSFEPDRAWVEMGSVSASGVSNNDLKGALRAANFKGCYVSALKKRGARATGTATLNLSIDGAGKIRGAVVTGAIFLPEMRGCLQGQAYGLTVSRVDTAGATGEVWLYFKLP